MGMFDSVWVLCPQCTTRGCTTRVEFQSKAGACELHDYTLETASQDYRVLADVSRDTETCPSCGASVGIQVVMMAQAVIR